MHCAAYLLKVIDWLIVASQGGLATAVVKQDLYWEEKERTSWLNLNRADNKH